MNTKVAEHSHHGHHHHHEISEKTVKYLLISFIINMLLTVVEIVGGIIAGSVSLIGDALHNTSDAFSILIAVIAFYCSFATLETYWGFTSPVMALPGFFMYGPVVIGMGMVLIRYAIEFIGFICGEVKPFETIGQGGVE